MLTKWLSLLAFGAIFALVQSLPAGLSDEAKKSEQLTRPKVKRTQELLMFANQQNRPATENKVASDFSPSAEKRTLSNSGLDDALAETAEQQQHQQHQHQQEQQQQQKQQQQQEQQSQQQLQQPSNNHPKPLSAGYMMDQPLALPQHEKNYNLPSYYQEPRYKRELNFDPEDFLALLSLYDSERRNRGAWRNYGNEEYETVDDDSNMIGLEDEDPRGTSWLDNAIGYPQQQQQQQHRYPASEPLLSSELAALARGRAAAAAAAGYYDQYPGQQQYAAGTLGSANGQQYDSGAQYGTPQYGVPYAQHAYYPPGGRFVVNRKRSQNYDSYNERSGLLTNSRGYPNYQHRLLY